MSQPFPPQPQLEPGRGHSPGFALLLALFCPGAGQAYNGQPVKGAFLLLTTPLVITWLFSLYDARAVASRLVSTGGRYGRGGLIWVIFHLWFIANLILLAVVGLTIAGVTP